MSNNPLPLVTIELDDGATIEAELYPDIAPNTVNSFISLINKGFYDGLTFHRVIPGFVIQGGCLRELEPGGSWLPNSGGRVYGQRLQE